MSRLKEWVTTQRDRHKMLSQYITLADKVGFCYNINGLFKGIGFPYDPNQLKLSMDYSFRSLKAVLLQNGNICLSIPMAHSVHLKKITQM